MGDPAVRTEGLTKHFGALRAVDDVNLVIERGEVFGYLGPNGAGKTTTVRLLLDFLRPTAGRAVVLGGSGADPEIRRRIGYLPGDLHLDPDYTGAEVLGLFGRLRGGVDQSWVDTLLERFNLDPSRRVGQLSTGNRRKVGVVQAFMSRPELLLLDEPTSGLDPLLQHEFNALVREVVADGATVLLSSHVLPEVEALAGRVGIVRRGRLVAVAGVEELRQAARLIRDRRRSLLWWSVGIVGLVLFTVALYPSLKGEESFNEVIEQMPEALRAMFGAVALVPGPQHAGPGRGPRRHPRAAHPVGGDLRRRRRRLPPARPPLTSRFGCTYPRI